MHFEEAKALAREWGRKHHGARRFFVIQEASDSWTVKSQHSVEVALQARYYEQRHIVYVTDGSD